MPDSALGAPSRLSPGEQGDEGPTAGPLLERDDELATFDRALASTEAGHGALVFVSGVAGVGKTRLLAEVRRRAELKGHLVAAGTGSPLERDFSFAMPLELFRNALSDEAARATLFGGAAALAAPLFDSPTDGEPTASRVFPFLHGLFWLTANVAAQGPLVIIVDDLHWVDPSSLRFVAYLSERIEDLQVLLVVALRSGEGDGERARLLAEVAALASQEATLRPLGDEASAQLVRSFEPEAEPGFCVACSRATGGNPFLLGELLRELGSEGIEPTEANAKRLESLAPEGVRRATLVRIARLGSGPVDLATAVAVLGDDAELRHAAALSGLTLGEAADAADLLVGAAILDSSAELGFKHPLVAAAVDADIPPDSRRRMHKQAAQRLDEEGASAERVAAHLLVAACEADPWTVRVLRRGSSSALARGSTESAINYLERALAEPAGNAQLEVLMELGRAETLGGSQRAVEHLEAAVQISADDVDRARAEGALGQALYVSGQMADACNAFERGARAAAGQDRELELQNEADFLQTATLVASRVADVVERLPAAVDAVGRDTPSAGGRAILAVAGLVGAMLGRPSEEAIELAERALDGGNLLAEEGADSNTLYSVTGVLSVAGRFAASERVLTEAIEAAQSAGSASGFAAASYSRAWPLQRRGALLEAIADLQAAIDTGWEQYLPVAYATLVDALRERDDLAEARSAANELDIGRWDAEPIFAQFCQARGRLSLAEGNPEAALADFERCPEIWPVPNPAFLSDWRRGAAVASAQLGDRDRAVALATEELDLLRSFGAPHALGAALRALGIAQGGHEGVASLQQAVATLADTEATVEYASAIVDLGAATRRAGKRSEGRKALRQGLDIAQRHGLLALERRATEELKLAGGKPRSRYVSGVQSLTPGELRVARMAAEGMSNREIAQALFVTIKAVQYHLGNCYRKLEIGSRTELPASLNDD